MEEKRVQRRLAAILAADVVDYSRLVAEDADVWPAVNVSCTGLILEFTGEVAAANWLRYNAQLARFGGLKEDDSCG